MQNKKVVFITRPLIEHVTDNNFPFIIQVYQEVADMLNSYNVGPTRQVSEVRIKINGLKKVYKKIVAKAEESGTDPSWIFYDDMNEIVNTKVEDLTLTKRSALDDDDDYDEEEDESVKGK